MGSGSPTSFATRCALHSAENIIRFAGKFDHAMPFNTVLEVEAFCSPQTCDIPLRSGRTAGRGARLVNRVSFARSSAPVDSKVPYENVTSTPATGVCAFCAQVSLKPCAFVQVANNSHEQDAAIQRLAAQQKAKASTVGVTSPQLVGSLVWACTGMQSTLVLYWSNS